MSAGSEAEVDEDRFKRRAAARPEAVAQLRHAVVQYAQALEAPDRVLEALRLAVSEALTNAVVHAYVGREPGDMVVEAWREAGHLVVRVTDDGHGLILGPTVPASASAWG